MPHLQGFYQLLAKPDETLPKFSMQSLIYLWKLSVCPILGVKDLPDSVNLMFEDLGTRSKEEFLVWVLQIIFYRESFKGEKFLRA